MADENKQKIYLRIRSTSCDNAISTLNGIFIETKSSLRVGISDFIIAETIPYDGISAFREYMYTVMLEIDPEEENSVISALRGAGIGACKIPVEMVSFMINMAADPVSRLTSILEDYDLGRNAAKTAAEEILDVLFADSPFDMK